VVVVDDDEDYVVVQRVSPEDLEFHNTLVDPDPDIGIGGLGDLKDGPGGAGADPLADDAPDDMDLEP
jgi:hypothetical protein